MSRALLLIIFAFLVGGCVSADPACYPVKPGEPSQDVIVFDNHWHTGIMLPFRSLPASLQSRLPKFRDFRYVGIGWGDGEFFRAPHPGPGVIFRALFASRGSVLLVMGFDVEPEDLFVKSVDIYRVPLRSPGIARIARTIDDSFATRDRYLINAGPGPYDDSEFFQAIGRYSVFHTCNQWTADMLRAGGLPITPAYASTAWNLAFQLQHLPDATMNGQPLPRRCPPRPVLRFISGSHHD